MKVGWQELANRLNEAFTQVNVKVLETETTICSHFQSFNLHCSQQVEISNSRFVPWKTSTTLWYQHIPQKKTFG